MALPETLGLISKTMDTLIDFVVNDEKLSKDFEKYLEVNNFNIERQNDLNDCLIGYILDEKTQGNIRVLDYFSQNNPDYDKKIINSFKNSFKSVFRVNKILKNAYSCTCLANEKDFELIPLVKMTNLRSIGLYDFIKARMIELDNVFYLLEIFDCYGQFREYIANVETVKCLIKYPESQTMYNDKKLKELQKSTAFFNEKFAGVFGSDEIITSNTLADRFLEDFNNLIENGSYDGISKDKYKADIEYKYFKLNEDEQEDFIKNAEFCILSPSIPPESEVLRLLDKLDIPYFSDLEKSHFRTKTSPGKRGSPGNVHFETYISANWNGILALHCFFQLDIYSHKARIGSDDFFKALPVAARIWIIRCQPIGPCFAEAIHFPGFHRLNSLMPANDFSPGFGTFEHICFVCQPIG